MNDSQTDYMEILESLLGSRREWEAVPEIVNLSIKAIARIVDNYEETFTEHKTLMNEQSLKLQQTELLLSGKITRKEVSEEVLSILNSRSSRKDEDSISQYQKLVKESLYDREREMAPTVEELKTIAEIIAEKQTEQAKLHFKNQLLSQKLELEDKISRLKEEVKGRMVDMDREKRDIVSQCRQAHSRIEESQVNSPEPRNQQKIQLLEMSNRRMTEGLSHLVTHLQDNFHTKQQLNLLMTSREREARSPPKNKKEVQKQPKHKNSQPDVSKQIERGMSKFKNQYSHEWSEFRKTIMKEMGKMVNTETVNTLIDSFQRESNEKHQNLSSSLGKLQTKILSVVKDSERQGKQLMVRSEKRAEKKGSPSKSYDNIHSSLLRLEKTMLEKQSSEIRKIEYRVQGKISAYDQSLIKELDRRERHLCEVIEETYNQHANFRVQEDEGGLRQSLKKLFDTNLYCRYLYIGTKECKKDSCVPWEKEALNNCEDNFVWKRDSSIVLVNSPGLYQLEAGLFGDIENDSILLLNGDPFAEIPKAVTSKTSGVKVRGAIFRETLLLPGKSKISMRVGQHFYGQAFIELRQM